MKLKIYLISAISLLFVSSCGDDFLDQEPITEPLSGEFIADELNLSSLVAAAYQPMRWEFNPIYGDSYCMTYLYTDVRSDDVIVENKFFQPHSHGFENFSDQTVTNINVRLIWTKFFTGVANANEIIQGLLNADESALDPTIRDLAIGEARFLRAFYYFELVKNYGAVPLFGDNPVDLGSKDAVSRKPVEDVYAQIESDLIEAASLLPTTQTEQYKATRGAALGLLSKAYLYQEKWQAAADAAQQVIDLGIYELEENYGDNWKLSNEYGKESLFEITYNNDNSGGSWNPTAQTSLTLQFFAPNFAPTLLAGWSYNLVTPELLNAFIGEGDTERLNASIMQEGHVFDSEILEGNGFSPVPIGFFDTWINSVDSNGQRYGDDFYFSLKYFLTPEEINEQTPGLQQSALNHKVLRYAEVLLILAEATVNGASGNGQAAFDMVRARAGLGSKPLTLDALKLERRLELATEWNRFHDLVRWGDAANEIEGFTMGRDELLPVPLQEILLTGTRNDGSFVLSQNRGY